jgi:hypothetical protein
MQHRFLPGYLKYPAYLLALTLAPQLAPSLGAQSAPAAQQTPAQQPADPSAEPAQQAPIQQAPIQELPQQTPQERARILRDAQARVQTRRRMRQQQVIQDTYTHKYEIYGGGGYVRFRPGPTLQHMNESAWNLGVTEWIRPKLGITGDFRGYYGVANALDFEDRVYTPSISQYTFMAGPQYHFYESQHWSWNAQVLAGIGHGNFDTGTRGVPASNVGVYSNGNVFNVSVGAAVDYNLSPTLAVRLMPNYLLTDYGSTLQHNLGFTSGIVYRWGRQ